MVDQIQNYIAHIADPRARQSLEALLARMSFGGDMRYTTFAEGEAVPASGGAGYSPGCKFTLSNASLGMSAEWVNIGTAASCLFVPVGPVLGYGFKQAGIMDATNGSTTDNIITGFAEENDLALVGFFASDDNDQSQAFVTAGKSYLTLKNSADPSTTHDYQWALLRNKCTPEWDIFAAGTHTTAGGGAAEAITVTGARAGDKAIVVYGATNDTDVIRQAVVTTNTLTVTCDADPSTAHSIHYVILRPRGTFKPSHYIAYAGTHTTVGGDATEVATITGALATDIPITAWHTSNDTDTILKAVLTANTLTWTLSADPSTAHKLNYAILRAY